MTVQEIPGETMIVAIMRMLEFIALEMRVSVKILITKYIILLLKSLSVILNQYMCYFGSQGFSFSINTGHTHTEVSHLYIR